MFTGLTAQNLPSATRASEILGEGVCIFPLFPHFLFRRPLLREPPKKVFGSNAQLLTPGCRLGVGAAMLYDCYVCATIAYKLIFSFLLFTPVC